MLVGAIIMLIGAPFGYYGTLQPRGAVLYGTLNMYYSLVFFNSGHHSTRATRRNHGALLHGNVSVRSII